MLASTHGVGISGSSARMVSVQVHRTKGARIHASGISWNAMRHCLARVFAAFETCGWQRPSGAITLHVGPEMHHAHTAHLDLPIAIGLLTSMGYIPSEVVEHSLFIGEIALDGSLSSTTSVPQFEIVNVPSPRNVWNIYTPGLIQPPPQTKEKRHIHRRCSHLSELVEALNGQRQLPILRSKNSWNGRIKRMDETASLFETIRLNNQQRLALLVAAAGQHHTLIIGPPGTGKSMMARCIHELLPPLNEATAMKLQGWHTSRGETMPLSEVPPFRAPHAQSSAAGLFGTWNKERAVAGECTMAHGGVLALDEFPEFNRSCIESLRTPMEQQTIQIGRTSGALHLPFQALVVATANPCPCGFFQDRQRKCSCTASVINRYLHRITGPISARFQLHLETTVEKGVDSALPSEATTGLSSLANARAAVQQVRKILTDQPGLDLTWDTASVKALEDHTSHHRCSLREVHSLKNIARTHALIKEWPECSKNSRPEIDMESVAFACQFRIFDRPNWWKNGQSTNWRNYPSEATKTEIR